jgi:zinc-binding in reverse transcriptase
LKEVNKELLIFNTSINKKLGNDQTIKFWKDRWITECNLQTLFPLLYDLASNKDVTISQIIGYNRFYLSFTRTLNNALSQQLQSLYTLLSSVALNHNTNIIIWRWSTSGLFSVRSCYNWLDFGGVKSNRFQITWSATIPLKIKIFFWLVQRNKILTKDNLRKKG